jgi:DNA-binding GntR family transcriptional regulator
MSEPSDLSGGAANGEVLQLERVYQEIKGRIVYGRYAPGAVLSESVLARVHHSSRTPVREALSRLFEEGYVQRIPRKGYLVAPLTIDVIRNTFKVRRLLEATAAESAAERADTESVSRMRGFADYPLLETSTESYLERLSVNDRFHLSVASATQNGFLVDLVRHCLTQHNRVLSLGLSFPILSNSVPQHHAIVDAIERRDPGGARRAMEHHLDDSFRLVTELVMHGGIRGIGV